MHVEISIDAHSSVVAFKRTIHPMHSGDLTEARKTLDKVYLEARAHLDRLIGHASPLPGTPPASEGS